MVSATANNTVEGVFNPVREQMADTLREFAFTDEHFKRLRSLVSLHTGISLSDAKRELVYSRLSRRLRELGLSSFSVYCGLLEAGDAEEVPKFVNAITTNLTSFFREAHHFQNLAENVLPEIMIRNASTRQIHIWSAGCSTGEEPYSIAIVVREFLANQPGWKARILATDIDSSVIETASSGIYAAERVESLSKERLKSSFRRGVGSNQGLVVTMPELQDMVSFRQLNLMQSWPMRSRFDIIFCRNVVIYFSKDEQRRLFDRFADALNPKGYLFIGHSESLFELCTRFESVGKTAYIRRI
jgi:chemotaxis protein methyltransferase CheR